MKNIYLLVSFVTCTLFSQAQFTVQLTADTAKCEGDTAHLTATITGSGTAPYTYNWAVSTGSVVSNNNTAQTVLGISDVTVDITVTDALNQTATAQWLIDAKGIRVDLPDTVVLNCGSTVTVYALVTGDSTGINYVWSTGASGATKKSHTFTDPNLYRVLTTNSFYCQSNWDSVWVVYPNGIYNEASFVPADSVLCQGIPAVFINTSVKTNGWSCAWLFGDTQMGFTKNGVNTYASPGVYGVKLVVDSADCDFESATQNVIVLAIGISPCNVMCNAAFYAYPDSASGIYIGVNYSAGANLSYLWDFGDGNTSTNPYPTHTYAQPGMYTICLTVSNSLSGCTDTYCDSSFYVFKTEGGLMSQLIIQSPLSVEEHQVSSIRLFPNPASDYITIETKDAVVLQWKLYNLNGQLLNAGKQTQNKIPLTGVNSGVYVMEIETTSGVARYRFIKN